MKSKERAAVLLSVKKISLTLMEAIQTHTHLAALTAEKMNLKAGYRVASILEQLDGPVGEYTKQHNKLVKELGAPDPENPEVSKVLPENKNIFETQINELLDTPVIVEFIPFKFSDLTFGGKEIEIRPHSMVHLKFLFDESEVYALPAEEADAVS